MEKFGRDLSQFAKFKLPNESVWRVELRRDEGKVWFQNGWNEFAEHFSISDGYFLFFQYLKRSTFYVVIFNQSGTPIKRLWVASQPENDSEVQAESDDDSEENSGSLAPTPPVASTEQETDTAAILKGMGIFFSVTSGNLAAEEKARAIAAARLFKPNGPAFMVILKPRNVKRDLVSGLNRAVKD